MPSSSVLLSLTLLLLSVWVHHVTGDYQVEITFLWYDNPTGQCDGCRQADSPTPGCCDNPDLEGGQCFGADEGHRSDTCDTSIDYCIRELGSTEPGCSEDQLVASEFAFENINEHSFERFFFGMDNPLLVTDNSSWMGVQLFLQSRDAILVNHGFADSILIDTFTIDIDVPVGVVTPPTIYTGNASIAQVNVSFEVNCSDNYYGPDCSTFCPDFQDCPGCGLTGYEGVFCQINTDDCEGVNCTGSNTRCLDGNNSFACVCNIGYTGGDCDVLIDHCVGVTCSGNGQCVNSIYGFTCTCIDGFTGGLCETDVDDCVGVSCGGNGQCVDGVGAYTCTCDSGYSGHNCQYEIIKSVVEETTTVTTVDGNESANTYDIVVSAVGGVILGVLALVATSLVIAATIYFVHKCSWRTAYIKKTQNCYGDKEDITSQKQHPNEILTVQVNGAPKQHPNKAHLTSAPPPHSNGVPLVQVNGVPKSNQEVT